MTDPTGPRPTWGKLPPAQLAPHGEAPTAGTPWVVVLALLALPPLGLLMMWTVSAWSTRTRIAVTAVVGPIVCVLVVVASSGWSGNADHDPSDPLAVSPTAESAEAPVLRALKGLRVAEDHPKRDYEREAFGPAWTDTDRNGCDTRNDILGRDLADVVVKLGTNGCAVLSGTLVDPYTGSVVPFQRGSAAVEIDHVVALADAWRSGASSWPYARSLAFANDPIGLLAVAADQNQAKSDADASEWLPPEGRCMYAARQVAVKAKYLLSVTAKERAALESVLNGCPGQALPSGGSPTLAPNRSPAPASPSPTSSLEVQRLVPPPSDPAPSSTQGLTDPDYGSCRDAQAAGSGPYYRDRDAEYDWYSDTDGDGVVCEQ